MGAILTHPGTMAHRVATEEFLHLNDAQRRKVLELLKTKQKKRRIIELALVRIRGRCAKLAMVAGTTRSILVEHGRSRFISATCVGVAAGGGGEHGGPQLAG